MSFTKRGLTWPRAIFWLVVMFACIGGILLVKMNISPNGGMSGLSKLGEFVGCLLTFGTGLIMGWRATDDRHTTRLYRE